MVADEEFTEMQVVNVKKYVAVEGAALSAPSTAS